MNIRFFMLVAAFVSVIFSQIASGTLFENMRKPVLSADTNHDGLLSLETIQKGQDVILIKPNPATLPNNALILQTKNFNLYTAANWDDLQAPEAYKDLRLAKVTRDGTIKVYTLANLGYSMLKLVQNPNGGSDVYLITYKGKMDKVKQLDYIPTQFHVYDPNANVDKKVKAT